MHCHVLNISVEKSIINCVFFPVWEFSESRNVVEWSSVCVCVWVTESCPTCCISMNCSPLGFSVHRVLQAWTLELVAISFSRESSWIFLIQGSNPGLLHCRQILYSLSHQGSPSYPVSIYSQIVRSSWGIFSLNKAKTAQVGQIKHWKWL